MTSTISENALRGQQSRIMAAMRAAATPKLGDDLRDIASALTTQNRGGASYFETMKKFGDAQKQTNINAETGIYAQMKEQVARGDAEASAVDKAITDIAGADPKIYASIADRLHADPEPVNTRNAQAKVMKYAAELGINPLSVQSEKAKIAKLNADAANTAKGGDVPASIKEWNVFNAMTPEDQAKYKSMKRTGAEEELGKKLAGAGAKSYADLQTKIEGAENFLVNTEVARDALSKAKLTGPVFGRVGKAASDPAYVNWQSSKNGLALLAKTVYDMPNNNFSEGDREFLVDIVGGKFPTKGAAEAVIDKLELIANKGIRNNKKHQQNILSRKTYNKDVPVEDVPDGDKVTPKRIKFSDLPE